MVTHRFLFNFAASYGGGGLKRLSEYAKWFNGNGGAWFIIHPLCETLRDQCPQNRFFLVQPSKLQRLVNDCSYLDEILDGTGTPDLYYSYGIPIYRRSGRTNWFHLSNVLPLCPWGVPLSTVNRLKFLYLGQRIRQNLCNADVISAESRHSLGLLPHAHNGRFVLSVNGSDDELALLREGIALHRDALATVVGTYPYKALGDAHRIFKMLGEAVPELQLVIIGNETTIPRAILRNPRVVATGILPRSEVIRWLRKSRYYISATRVENSYNAASEGIFLAEESYISSIGPHLELLAGMCYQPLRVPGVEREVLHVRRAQLTGENLNSWEQVITEMIREVEKALTLPAKEA